MTYKSIVSIKFIKRVQNLYDAVRTRLSCGTAGCVPRPEVARVADAMIQACILAGAHTSPCEGNRVIMGQDRVV